MLLAVNASCRLLQEEVQKTAGYKMFKFLEQLGLIYPVKFRNGRDTIACIVTYLGIKRILGVKDAEGLREIYQGCGGKEDFNEGKDVNRQGILVNLDFYQHAALLKAIYARIPPKLARKTGFYSLRGSKKVCEVLDREKVHEAKGVSWFWTGEKFIFGLEKAYTEEELVRGGDIGAIEGSRFCCRDIGCSWTFLFDPDGYNVQGVPLLGGFI